MKRILNRHWSFLPTGPALAVLLIVFWFFNQSYLAPSKSTVALFLENPIITFGLIIFGAHIGAFLSGEFSIKMPITFEPLVFALVGGLIAGVGAVVAEMSVHSTILFNLAGIFTLPAFMITKGWIYGIFMVLGGFTASKLLVLVIVKTVHKNREILVPEILKLRRKHRIVFIVLVSIFLTSVILVMMLPQLNYSERTGLVSAMLLLALFGFVTERGTICMSSMLKEWFISRSAYIW